MNVCLIKRIRFTILFLIYICVLLSCNRQELKTLNAQKLTGEALFQQIVLIEGKNIDKKIPEYVQVVEELSKLTPKELRARKIFNDYIIQEIKNNYPDYFGKLQEAVYSKQLYAIKQTLNEGRNALINTLRLSNKYGGLLKSIEKFAKQNAENYNINSKDGQDRFINDLASYLEISNIDSNEQGRGFLINKVAGIFMHVVIAVDFVAAVNTFLLRQSPGFFNDQNNIFFEKVVVSISKNY